MSKHALLHNLTCHLAFTETLIKGCTHSPSAQYLSLFLQLLTSHIWSWKKRRSFSISSAISAPLISVRIIPCCRACSFFSFSILVLQGAQNDFLKPELYTHTRAHLHHYVSYRCSNSTSVLLYGHSISFIKRKAKKSQDSRVSINDGVRAFYFRQGNHWIYLF